MLTIWRLISKYIAFFYLAYNSNKSTHNEVIYVHIQKPNPNKWDCLHKSRKKKQKCIYIQY